MNFTSKLFCVCLIISFAAAENSWSKLLSPDLRCHSCFYKDGHPDSDLSCLNDPAFQTIRKCNRPFKLGLLYGTTSTNGIDFTPRNSSCFKYTGKLDGKMVVIRGCEPGGGAFFNLNCTNSAYIVFNAKSAEATEACFCSTNNCNGLSLEPMSTTREPPRNDASSYHLASNLLFALKVYSIYKFMS